MGKEGGLMDYVKNMNEVLDYIETHIQEEISLDVLADKAQLSKYHFFRVFHSLIGISPSKYIRYRKLSCAVKELLHTKKRVIDVAYKYNYQSQGAFTRAIKNYFKMTPEILKRNIADIRLYERRYISPVDIQTLSVVERVETHIIEKDRFKIVGLRYTGHNKKEIYKLWEKFNISMHEIKYPKRPGKCLGVCTHDISTNNKEIFTYYACMEVGGVEKIPKGMFYEIVPASKYAVFKQESNIQNIQHIFAYIYGKWLPKTGYVPSSDLEITISQIEYYINSQPIDVDIYIPIK